MGEIERGPARPAGDQPPPLRIGDGLERLAHGTAAGESDPGEAAAQRLVGEHAAARAVDNRVMVGLRNSLACLLEDRTQEPEPRVGRGARRRPERYRDPGRRRRPERSRRLGEIVHDDRGPARGGHGPLFGATLASSAATPGRVRPSSHSRKAPPAVDT